jgi:hypothetical protein
MNTRDWRLGRLRGLLAAGDGAVGPLVVELLASAAGDATRLAELENAAVLCLCEVVMRGDAWASEDCEYVMDIVDAVGSDAVRAGVVNTFEVWGVSRAVAIARAAGPAARRAAKHPAPTRHRHRSSHSRSPSPPRGHRVAERHRNAAARRS